jgi:hypothetical protein
MGESIRQQEPALRCWTSTLFESRTRYMPSDRQKQSCSADTHVEERDGRPEEGSE